MHTCNSDWYCWKALCLSPKTYIEVKLAETIRWIKKKKKKNWLSAFFLEVLWYHAYPWQSWQALRRFLYIHVRQLSHTAERSTSSLYPFLFLWAYVISISWPHFPLCRKMEMVAVVKLCVMWFSRGHRPVSWEKLSSLLLSSHILHDIRMLYSCTSYTSAVF